MKPNPTYSFFSKPLDSIKGDLKRHDESIKHLKQLIDDGDKINPNLSLLCLLSLLKDSRDNVAKQIGK